ncbi:MAG: hypothetical protein KDB88_09715 [Flavobacteriales bacterium]|nr:hypothetical protein [Flavobacteriales bacterium]
MRGLLTGSFLVLTLALTAQNDTLSTTAEERSDSTSRLSWEQRHSPARATLYSALLPGSGQVYNRKYWKVPIVLAGLGTSYYFIRQNRTEYLRYKEAYIAVVDGDPDTIDEFEGRFSAAQLLDVTDTYRRWMEWSYIAIGLVYLLNVVDAAVDAHFVRFDVSPDLTLGIGPSLGLAAQGALGLQIGLNL